jgi:hypothetical protein
MRRSILIAIVFLSALVLGQTTQTAKTSNSEADAQRFLGAWRVLSVIDTRPDGTVVPDLYLGPHPIGFIIYEATGHMCFGAMNSDRAKWADELNGKPAEMSAATEGYDSYCGLYEIDEERKTVTHYVRVALVPNDVQTNLVRKYEFSGNQLRLTGANGLKPEFKSWTVTFERATRAR